MRCSERSVQRENKNRHRRCDSILRLFVENLRENKRKVYNGKMKIENCKMKKKRKEKRREEVPRCKSITTCQRQKFATRRCQQAIPLRFSSSEKRRQRRFREWKYRLASINRWPEDSQIAFPHFSARSIRRNRLRFPPLSMPAQWFTRLLEPVNWCDSAKNPYFPRTNNIHCWIHTPLMQTFARRIAIAVPRDGRLFICENFN